MHCKNIIISLFIYSFILSTGPLQAIAEEATKRAGIVTLQGKPLTLLGNIIKVGEKAPDFTAVNRVSTPISLSDYDGKVRIITAFASINTEVCSVQVRRFNQEAAKLDNVKILSISMDLPFALDRFCGAHGIHELETLSDHKEADFAKKYGFLIEELNLLARGTVIVDKQGVIQYVEYVADLDKEPDYAKAIETARQLTN